MPRSLMAPHRIYDQASSELLEILVAQLDLGPSGSLSWRCVLCCSATGVLSRGRAWEFRHVVLHTRHRKGSVALTVTIRKWHHIRELHLGSVVPNGQSRAQEVCMK